MSSESYGRTAGTRYCRAARHRSAAPRAAFVVRHGATGIVLARTGRSREPEPEPELRRKPWGGVAGAAVAGAALVISMGLLFAGGPAGRPKTGPCAPRDSVEAYSGGHVLRLRAEPGTGVATLVHLCAADSIGRIRSWAIRVEGADGTAAVQRVADRVALASVPIAVSPTSGSPAMSTSGTLVGAAAGPGATAMTVTVVPESGRPLVFRTGVTVGAGTAGRPDHVAPASRAHARPSPP